MTSHKLSPPAKNASPFSLELFFRLIARASRYTPGRRPDCPFRETIARATNSDTPLPTGERCIRVRGAGAASWRNESELRESHMRLPCPSRAVSSVSCIVSLAAHVFARSNTIVRPSPRAVHTAHPRTTPDSDRRMNRGRASQHSAHALSYGSKPWLRQSSGEMSFWSAPSTP